MTNKQKRAILMAQLEQKVMDSTIKNARSAKVKSDAVFVYQNYLDAQLDEITKRSDILSKNRDSKKKLLTELKNLNNRRESISRFVYKEIEDDLGNVRYFKVTPTQPRVTMIKSVPDNQGGFRRRKKSEMQSVEDITDVSYIPIFTELKDRMVEIPKDVYDSYVFEREELQNRTKFLKEEIQKTNKVYMDLVKRSKKFEVFKDRYEILEKQIKRGEYYLDLLNTDRKKFDAIEYDEGRGQWIPVIKDEVVKEKNPNKDIIPLDEKSVPTSFQGISNEKDSSLFGILPKPKEVLKNTIEGVRGVGNTIQEKINNFKGQPITDSMGKNQTQVEAQQNSKLAVMQNRILKNQNNNVSGFNLKKNYV